MAFVYPGSGDELVGMSNELYRTEPVFRSALDYCVELVKQERGESLLEVMFGKDGIREDSCSRSGRTPPFTL